MRRPRFAALMGADALTVARTRVHAGGGADFHARRPVEEPWEAWIRRAFADAFTEFQRAPGRIDIVILRPLAWGKILVLPAVDAEALESVVTLAASRLFPWTDGPVAAAAVPAEDGGCAAGRRALVFGAPESTLTAARQAACEAGFTCGSLWAAPALAWAVASRPDAAGEDSFTGLLRVPVGRVTELVSLRAGAVVALIPVADHANPEAGESARSWLAAAGLPAGPVREFGTGDAERAMLAELPRLGDGLPPLRTPAEAAHSRRRGRRLRLGLLAVSALLLAAAGALRLLDLRRERDGVAEAREAIRPAVERATDVRATAAGVFEALDQLRTAQDAAPVWTVLFRDLAASLPDSAHLRAVRGRADSLLLTGAMARGGGGAFRIGRRFTLLEFGPEPHSGDGTAFAAWVAWQGLDPAGSPQTGEAGS